MSITLFKPFNLDTTKDYTFANITGTGNVVANNANLGNLVTANYFSGNGSLLTGIVASTATTAGTVTTNAQPNITSVGTLNGVTITGTANFIGSSNVALGTVSNLHISGGTSGYVLSTDGSGTLSWVAQTTSSSYGNSNVADYLPTYTGNVSANYFIGNGSTLSTITGANINGNVNSAVQSHYANIANSVSGSNVSGQVGNALVAGTVYTNAQPNITSIGTLASLNVTANITSGNADLGNLVTANYFSGNGIYISNIAGANVSGTVANATYATSAGSATSATSATTAGTVTTNAQPNITSVGTLVSLNVSGDATVTGNFTVGGNTTYINVDTFRVEDPIIELGGGVNGAALTSNDGKDRGSLLHYYTTGAVDAFMGWDNSNGEFAFGSNVSVSSDVVTFNTFGNVRASYFIGNGSTLTYLTGSNVNGNVTSAVQSHYANIANSVAGSNVSGQVGNALVAGTVYTNAQPNITSLGTLASLSVTANITSGNADLGNLATASYFSGNGIYISNIAGANVSGTVANATYATSAGSATSATSATTAGTVTTNAQPNITSVGTIAGLTGTGVFNLTGTSNVALGVVGNVHISGGTAGYVLSTDGSGALSWVAQSGGSPGGSNTYVQFNDGSTFGGNAGLTFNKTSTTLTANNFIATSTANLGAVGNVTITGGSANYVLQTNGSGTLSWVPQSGGGATSATVDNFTGNGVQTVFTLSVTPASENDTIVNYNGVILQKSVYSLSGSDITFVSPPASGSLLEITSLNIVSTSGYATTGKAIAMAMVFGF